MELWQPAMLHDRPGVRFIDAGQTGSPRGPAEPEVSPRRFLIRPTFTSPLEYTGKVDDRF